MTRLPDVPLRHEEVVERWPTLRQSLLGEFDNCPLSTFLSLKYAQGWNTTPQALGILFHRTAAEILRTMQRTGSVTIPPSEAIEILIEQAYQRDVAAADVVRVPMRKLPELRMAVRKFAADNEFSVHKIVDIEKRLEAEVRYEGKGGVVVRRRVTGQLDVLLYDPPDGAIVIDWKASWGMPPEPRDTEPQGYDDEELKALSFMGYFQQRLYGWLVMMNYANVNRVTLREFYPYRTKVRKATLHRHQLPDVEQEIGVLCAAFDAALEQGAPHLDPDAEGHVNIDELGWWKPQPGRHCGFCVRPTSCPIPEDVRVAAGGAVTSAASASLWASRLQIAERIRGAAREGLKGYVEGGGEPVPLRWAKGRSVIGWYQTKRGRRFGIYTPDESDRGGHEADDERLREAMREATDRAREERGVKPRRRGKRRKVSA